MVLLSLHLSFSLLFLNTFLFLPTSSFIKRKLEMQEHIVTVGCFHLHSHLWHSIGDSTYAWLWTKGFLFYQNDKTVRKINKPSEEKLVCLQVFSFMLYLALPVFLMASVCVNNLMETQLVNESHGWPTEKSAIFPDNPLMIFFNQECQSFSGLAA